MQALDPHQHLKELISVICRGGIRPEIKEVLDRAQNPRLIDTAYVDKKARTAEGRTPLAYAVAMNNQRVVRDLVTLGANLDVVMGATTTALTLALTNSRRDGTSMVRTLLHAGRIDEATASRVARWSHAGETDAPPRPKSAEAGTAAAAKATTGSPPHTWDINAVGAWLQDLGLGQHASAFAHHRVDGRLLLQVDEQDLVEELGVASRLERKRILSHIERLREGVLL